MGAEFRTRAPVLADSALSRNDHRKRGSDRVPTDCNRLGGISPKPGDTARARTPKRHLPTTWGTWRSCERVASLGGMSWETNEHRSPCPCGKGELITTSKSNDFNHTEDAGSYFTCQECAKQHETRTLYAGDVKNEMSVTRTRAEWAALDAAAEAQRQRDIRATEELRAELGPEFAKALRVFSTRPEALQAVRRAGIGWLSDERFRKHGLEGGRDLIRLDNAKQVRAFIAEHAGRALPKSWIDRLRTRR